MRQLRTDLSARIDLIDYWLLTRLGGLTVVVARLLFTAQHYWPPHT